MSNREAVWRVVAGRPCLDCFHGECIAVTEAAEALIAALDRIDRAGALSRNLPAARQVEYVRRSRFEKGLDFPKLLPYLQRGLQDGSIVVLDDDEFIKRFPDVS